MHAGLPSAVPHTRLREASVAAVINFPQSASISLPDAFVSCVCDYPCYLLKQTKQHGYARNEERWTTRVGPF